MRSSPEIGRFNLMLFLSKHGKPKYNHMITSKILRKLLWWMISEICFRTSSSNSFRFSLKTPKFSVSVRFTSSNFRFPSGFAPSKSARKTAPMPENAERTDPVNKQSKTGSKVLSRRTESEQPGRRRSFSDCGGFSVRLPGSSIRFCGDGMVFELYSIT